MVRARLVAPNSATYIAPAAATQVLRDIEIVTSSAAASSGFIYLHTATGGQDVIVYQWTALAFQQHLQWDGRVVFEPGDELNAVVDTAQADVYLSGYNLAP